MKDDGEQIKWPANDYHFTPQVKSNQSSYPVHGDSFHTPGTPGTSLVFKITVFVQEPLDSTSM